MFRERNDGKEHFANRFFNSSRCFAFCASSRIWTKSDDAADGRGQVDGDGAAAGAGVETGGTLVESAGGTEIEFSPDESVKDDRCEGSPESGRPILNGLPNDDGLASLRGVT